MEHIDRIHLLLDQGKPDLATKEVNEQLAEDPNNAYLLSLKALCNLELSKPDDAIEVAKIAVRNDPNSDFALYILSSAYLQVDAYKKSEEAILRAIEIDAHVAQYYGVWSNLLLIKRDYEEAKEIARKGLAIDPENLLARNVLAKAQVKSGEKEASFQTMDKALEIDPENNFTHANYGWVELERGSHKKAMQHFAEALKKDPNDMYARSGMLEALKAKYWIYRVFLKYYFFMSNQKPRTQWVIIIGIYLLGRFMSNGAEWFPQAEMVFLVIMFMLGFFIISTWIVEPVFNFFMLLNQYSRHLLTVTERQTARMVGTFIVLFGLSLLTFAFLQQDYLITAAIVAYSMIIPVGKIYTTDTKWKDLITIVYSFVMLLLGGFAVIASSYEDFGIVTNIFNYYVIGLAAFTWIWNLINTART